MADVNRLFQRANHFFNKGKVKEANKIYKKIVKQVPGFVDAINMYGISLAQLGELSSAVSQFNKIIKLEPGKPAAYENIARVYMQMQRYDLAQKMFEKALELGPATYNACFGLAGTFMSQNNFDQAIEIFDKAKTLNPSDPLLFINMGTAFSQTRRYSEAVAAFNSAIILDAKSAEAYLRLGQCHLHNNNSAMAEDALLKARQTRSDDFNIELSLADAYQKNSKFELAIQHYLIADKLQPMSQNVYTKLDKLILQNSNNANAPILQCLSEAKVYGDWSEAIDDAKKLAQNIEYHDKEALLTLQQFFDTYEPGKLHSKEWWQKNIKLFGDKRFGHDKILRGIHSAVFSWSLPDREALTAIAIFVGDTRLYSYGAGSALWERLLSEHFSIETVAIDFKPRHSYLPILTEDYSTSVIPEGDTIFLSWVIRGDTGVLNILDNIRPGQKLILIGEPRDKQGIPRICGTPEMFEKLDSEFLLSETIPLVSFSMLNDTVSLYVKT